MGRGKGHERRRYALFRIAGKQLALPAENVRRAMLPVALHAVPERAGSIRGALALGGQVLPVLDLAMFLGMPPEGTALTRPFLQASLGDRDLMLQVDAVVELVEPSDGPDPLDERKRGFKFIQPLPRGP